MDDSDGPNWYTAEAYPDARVRWNLLRHAPPPPDVTPDELLARGLGIHNARVHLMHEPRQLVECRCRPHFAR